MEDQKAKSQSLKKNIIANTYHSFLLYQEHKNRGSWLAYLSLDYQVAPDLNPSAAHPKTF